VTEKISPLFIPEEVWLHCEKEVVLDDSVITSNKKILRMSFMISFN